MLAVIVYMEPQYEVHISLAQWVGRISSKPSGKRDKKTVTISPVSQIPS